MNIQSTSAQNNAHGYGQIKRQQQEAQFEQSNTNKTPDVVKTESSTIQTPTDPIDIGEAEGVIRNLQKGHYKGVAQLRLSVVHAERFQQAASQEAAKVIDTEGGNLTSSIREKIESFYTPSEVVADSTEPAVPENVETAIKEFEAAVASSQEGPENEPPTIETFKKLYSTAFLDLLGKLGDSEPVEEGEGSVQAIPIKGSEEDIAISELVEDTAESQPTTTVVEQEAIGVAADLNELKVWFNGELDSSLEKIQSQVDTISTPPLPSQPTGNGAAYVKFLSAYEKLYGTTGQQTVSTPLGETNTIETEA